MVGNFWNLEAGGADKDIYCNCLFKEPNSYLGLDPVWCWSSLCPHKAAVKKTTSLTQPMAYKPKIPHYIAMAIIWAQTKQNHTFYGFIYARLLDNWTTPSMSLFRPNY